MAQQPPGPGDRLLKEKRDKSDKRTLIVMGSVAAFIFLLMILVPIISYTQNQSAIRECREKMRNHFLLMGEGEKPDVVDLVCNRRD
jgi:hypothetical protein